MPSNIQESQLAGQNLDALVVGAGFSGVYELYNLRKLGYNVKAFEAGGDLGGTWYWNCYPGIRVDSDFSIYQFAMEDLWKDWNYTERFPHGSEVHEYFHYVDKKLDLSRDIVYNTRVVAAEFNSTTNRWAVTTQDGSVVHPRFLLMCVGTSAKPFTPSFKGLNTFKGTYCHASRWPREGVDFKGKRIGIVGTGATGVQIIQEAGPQASHLTVFQRTPMLTLPMRQCKLDGKMEGDLNKDLHSLVLRRREQTSGGFHYDWNMKSVFDLTPEARELYWEELWSKGGFHFWLEAFEDTFRDERANDEVYKFWKKKVRARLNDPEMQRKLAPDVPYHPFGVKRPALEQRYYEVFNQSNTTLVDVNENPIVEITPKGVKTQDGTEHEFDILILATGYDAVTGSITQINMRGTDGVLVRDKWSKGLSTYLGMTVANYPNMFFTYGPQSPTALCNGPTCIVRLYLFSATRLFF
jgi:cation diffusion facilitator CzcD-associated flavoprotein CzcO